MNKKPLIFALAIMTGVAAVVALAIFFKPSTQMADARLAITASADFWGDIATQIGGDRVQVTSILDDPEADPHLYESGAKDASVITSADIVIANGLGYDDFMDKVVAASPTTNRTYIKVADVLGMAADANPHIWYDLPRTAQVATAFADALAQKDPAGSATYKANLARFTASLQPLLDTLAAIKTAHDGAAIAYTERVPEYLVAAAGLRVVSPASFAAAIEEGNEPSPADQTAMRDLITGKKIRALLYNPQAESEVTQEIQDAAGANAIPEVAITETAPAGKNFQAWQQAQLDALRAALDNSR